MINSAKLQKILVSYKENFVSKRWHEESYKWEAVKCFQDNWDINANDFNEMLALSLSKTKNLLESGRKFSKKMIIYFSEKDPEVVRKMFINLYDENLDLATRIDDFKTMADQLMQKYGKKGNHHFQNTNAITVYLWLRFPDKYYDYLYTVCKIVAEVLESDFAPASDGKAITALGGFKLYDEIWHQIQADDEIASLLKSVMNDKYYPDSELRTLAWDVAYYISQLYSNKKAKDVWYPKDYEPGISVEKWVELLHDRVVFTSHSLEIMKRLKDIGGEATCIQLSQKYGESNNFYNAGSSSLAKRVYEKTGCLVYQDDNEDNKWWPILYLGKKADNKEKGSFVWKLRDELSTALEQVDLSTVNLLAENNAIYNYNPAIWKISQGDLSVEENNIFAEKKVIVVHKETKAKASSRKTQGEDFMETMQKGDYFYLCYGNKVQLLGQLVSNEITACSEKTNGWYQRAYKVVTESQDKINAYTSKIKWWTPNENSTCIRVPVNEYYNDIIN